MSTGVDIDDALDRLARAGVHLAPGLSTAEFVEVEARFGFRFGADHRRLLQGALPLGDRWVDWRLATNSDIRARLAWPVDGVVFDVENNSFWPRSWGTRPPAKAAAVHEARRHLAAVPVLVPLYGHRYLPSDPAPTGAPVLSVYQADVIYYGDNLLDYIAHEFHIGSLSPTPPGQRVRIPFWSDLAEGATSDDL